MGHSLLNSIFKIYIQKFEYDTLRPFPRKDFLRFIKIHHIHLWQLTQNCPLPSKRWKMIKIAKITKNGAFSPELNFQDLYTKI